MNISLQNNCKERKKGNNSEHTHTYDIRREIMLKSYSCLVTKVIQVKDTFVINT